MALTLVRVVLMIVLCGHPLTAAAQLRPSAPQGSPPAAETASEPQGFAAEPGVITRVAIFADRHFSSGERTSGFYDWGTHTELGGRFRLKDQSLDEKSAWSWQENPFVGTQPYQGLLVLLMMFNSTDLKNSNNSLYERRTGNRVEQWYVVRDIGAALGDANRFAPLKGDADAFERQPFILGVNNGFVDFAHKGWYQNLVRDRIKPEDVRWACNLLGELSERQWQDAFRAGGFEGSEANRFIRKLREKVEQGRSLPATRASTREP